MRTALRLLFFMILSCHDSVASSSVGRICGIPLTIIPLTSLWPFPFSIVALVAALPRCVRFKPTEKNRFSTQSRKGAKAQRVFSALASLRLAAFALKGLFYP
jgi:hypothetical protein